MGVIMIFQICRSNLTHKSTHKQIIGMAHIDSKLTDLQGHFQILSIFNVRKIRLLEIW